jgi:hypothetical protein
MGTDNGFSNLRSTEIHELIFAAERSALLTPKRPSCLLSHIDPPIGFGLSTAGALSDAAGFLRT